jgi:hypothetical protein
VRSVSIFTENQTGVLVKASRTRLSSRAKTRGRPSAGSGGSTGSATDVSGGSIASSVMAACVLSMKRPGFDTGFDSCRIHQCRFLLTVRTEEKQTVHTDGEQEENDESYANDTFVCAVVTGRGGTGRDGGVASFPASPFR